MGKKDSKKKAKYRESIEKLEELGSPTTYRFDSPEASVLETFESPAVSGYTVRHVCTEFTSLCPKTGQPDYGEISIEYTPDKVCVESKSLKLYLMAYRNEGAFMEDMVNRIADDLQSTLHAVQLIVRGVFRSRGGIETQVLASRYNGS